MAANTISATSYCVVKMKPGDIVVCTFTLGKRIGTVKSHPETRAMVMEGFGGLNARLVDREEYNTTCVLVHLDHLGDREWLMGHTNQHPYVDLYVPLKDIQIIGRNAKYLIDPAGSRLVY